MFVLAVGRLLFVDTFRIADRAAFVPIFNKYCLPALAVAGCVLGSSVAVRRLQRFTNKLDRIGGVIAGLGGVLLVWFVLSVETYQYFDNEGDRWVSDEQVKRLAQTSLSVLWAVYAGVILAVGFWLGSRPLRWMALGLFALTLGKVVLIDMSELPDLYRILAFFALAVVLGAAAWGYQKIERMRTASSREGQTHEAN